MSIPEKIFKAYDIRGIYPSEINEENIPAIIRAIVKVINPDNQKPFKVSLGRDMRLSSPALFEVAQKTLVDLGIDVVDIGLVSTPTLYYSVIYYKCDGGIQISASHNPKDYNGIKMVKKGETGLIKIGKSTGMDEVKKYALEDSGGEESSEKGKVETINTDELITAEVQNAMKIAGLSPSVALAKGEDLKIDKYKIVIDTANAMGATYLKTLFEVVPAETVKINFELDGSFPAHPADPLVMENTQEVRDRVVAENADLGITTDGDGDRLMFIDEKGSRVEPSKIIALVARELLTDNPGEKIFYDIRYTFTPKTIIEEHGGTPVMTRVGHAFITEKMNAEGGIFGGESSGHNFFRDTGNAESQIPVVLLVLKAMTRTGKKLSELAEEVKRSYESEEINFKVENATELMDILEKEFATEGEIVKIDGVAVSFPDWRFLVRPSNTEPILRLTVEELGADAKGDKKEHVIKLINQHARFVEG